MSRTPRGPLLLSLLFSLASCSTFNAPLDRAYRIGANAPPDAPPNTCWDKVVTPARIETITEQIMVAPPVVSADGELLVPASFTSNSHQVITQERIETFFETLCPSALSYDYVASIQRALAARNLYGGEITGVMSRDTRNAIRAYQAPLGINSATLSLQAARKLGLSPIRITPK